MVPRKEMAALFEPSFAEYNRLMADAAALVPEHATIAAIAYDQIKKTEEYAFIPDTYLALARLYAANDNKAMAIANCETVLRLAPFVLETYEILAALYEPAQFASLLKQLREIKTEHKQLRPYHHQRLRSNLLSRPFYAELNPILVQDVDGTDDKQPYAIAFTYYYYASKAFGNNSRVIARYYLDKALAAFPDDFLSQGMLCEINYVEACEAKGTKATNKALAKALRQMDYVISTYNFSRVRLLRGMHHAQSNKQYLSGNDFIEAMKNYLFEDVIHFNTRQSSIIRIFEFAQKKLYFLAQSTNIEVEQVIYARAKCLAPEYEKEGNAQLDKKNYQEALFYYSMAIWYEDCEFTTNNVRSSHLYLMRAQIHLILGNVDEANLNFHYAGRFHNSVDEFFSDGATYQIERFVRLAQHQANSPQNIKNKYARYSMLMKAADLFFSTEYKRFALELYVRAIREFPHLPDAYHGLCQYNMLADGLSAARDAIDLALKITPLNKKFISTALTLNGGFSEEETEKLVLAKAKHQRFEDWYHKTKGVIHSDETSALCFLGIAAFFDSRHDVCIHYLEQVLTIHQNDVVARTYLGLVHYLQINIKAASDAFQICIQNGNYPLARFGMGLIAFERGENKLAKNCLLDAIKTSIAEDMEVFEKFETTVIDIFRAGNFYVKGQEEDSYKLGKEKFDAGEYGAARQLFSPAIWSSQAMNKSLTYKYYFYRSYAFLKLGLPEKATQDVKKALAFSEKYKIPDEDILILKQLFATYCLTPIGNFYTSYINPQAYYNLGINVHPTPELLRKRAHQFQLESNFADSQKSLREAVKLEAIIAAEKKEAKAPTPEVQEPETIIISASIPEAMPQYVKSKKSKPKSKVRKVVQAQPPKPKRKIVSTPAEEPVKPEPVLETKDEVTVVETEARLDVPTPTLEEVVTPEVVTTIALPPVKPKKPSRSSRRHQELVEKRNLKKKLETPTVIVEENQEEVTQSEALITTPAYSPSTSSASSVRSLASSPTNIPTSSDIPNIEKLVRTFAEIVANSSPTPTPGETITPDIVIIDTPDLQLSAIGETPTRDAEEPSVIVINPQVQASILAAIDTVINPATDFNTVRESKTNVVELTVAPEEISQPSLTRTSTNGSRTSSDVFVTPLSSPASSPAPQEESVNETVTNAAQIAPFLLIKTTDEIKAEIAQLQPEPLPEEKPAAPTPRSRLNPAATFFQPRQFSYTTLITHMPKQCALYNLEAEFLSHIAPGLFEVYAVGGSVTDRVLKAYLHNLLEIPNPPAMLINYLNHPMFKRPLIVDDLDIVTTLPLENIAAIAVKMGLTPLAPPKPNAREQAEGFAPAIQFLSYIKNVNGTEVKIDFVHKDVIKFEDEAYERDSGLFIDMMKQGLVVDFSGVGLSDLVMGVVRLTIMDPRQYQLELLKLLHTIHTSTKRSLNILEKEQIKQCFWLEQNIQPSYINSALRKLFFPGRILANYALLHEFEIFGYIYGESINTARLQNPAWVLAQLQVSETAPRCNLQFIHAIFVVNFVMQNVLSNASKMLYTNPEATFLLDNASLLNTCILIINESPILANAFSGSAMITSVLEKYLNKWREAHHYLLQPFETPVLIPPPPYQQSQQSSSSDTFSRLPNQFSPSVATQKSPTLTHPENIERSESAPPEYRGPKLFHFHHHHKPHKYKPAPELPANNQRLSQKNQTYRR